MLKHIKVTERKPADDGVVEISTKSYHDHLTFESTEYEKIVYTSEQAFFKDLMMCAELITKEKSPEVVITIKQEYGEPRIIKKRWVTVKKHYKKR